MTEVISTPSGHRMSSRSLSQNTQNTVKELKEDLVVDVRRSQPCNLDDLLKFNLFSILDDEEAPQEKEDLDCYQKLIENLERKLDVGVRTKAAKGDKENTQTQAEGERSDQSDPEITQWQNELKKLGAERQKILDCLFNECLEKVLPICDDAEVRRHLAQYSEARVEADLYRPFVKLCNRALDLLKRLPSDKFRPTSSLNCRFHLNDPMVIKSHYGDSSVHSKPDIIITSTVAAGDVALNSENPIYHDAPKKGFRMRQVLGSGEFKRRDTSLTAPLAIYNKKRQSIYKCDDDELSLLYPLEESVPGSDVFNNETGIDAPPAKRVKIDRLEPAGTSSNTRVESSNTRNQTASSRTRRAKAPKTKTPRTTKSTGGTGSKDMSRHYPANNSKNIVDARTQCALYGMEMLSYAVGVHHAITFLVIDCKLWVWYYDRQGVIQTDGIDFVEDLPRFLVLLFTFQCFELRDWGVISELNPGAVLAHEPNPVRPIYTTRAGRSSGAPKNARLEREKETPTCTLDIAENFDGDSLAALGREHPKKIKIDLDTWLSHKPHCLGGRATTVLGSSDPDDATHSKLACKISFPEIARGNEGKIIEELRKEIEQDAGLEELSKHLPDVLMYGDMSSYGTQRIRSMLNLPIEGCRILRVLVSRKMAPLTSLAGAEFIKAWLEVVKFHAFLWSRNIEHGDPSLWNVMYNENLKCGVLGDYDLSISRRQPRVPGTDRTGTIPFMATDLLTDEYWRGEVERLYRHELEAFIWILPFVFLRYQDGKSRTGTLVDEWMTSDHVTCRKSKSDFMNINMLPQKEQLCQSDFKDHWLLAEHLLIWWSRTIQYSAYNRMRGISESSGMDDSSVASVWPLFVAQLRLASKNFPSRLGYVDKLIDDLGLERPFLVQGIDYACQ